MRRTILVTLAISALLALCVTGALAKGIGTDKVSAVPLPDRTTGAGEFAGERLDTLWIFDATFENTSGNNAGWTTSDQSGTLASTNYWHRDTVRTYYGDWNWWCGTRNSCWRQPRGYGNNWKQPMWRSFPEVAANTTAGDLVQFTFKQRYAIEKDYDYGYLDVSNNGGSTWTSVKYWTNGGFPGTPGTSQNWTSANGTYTHDFSAYAGQTVVIRFRMESDGAYSSQDQYNNPPLNSCLDGAWMLDNLEWKKNGVTFWSDTVEGGENGWQHPSVQASGQTGVVFWRGRYGVDFVTGRDFTCPDPNVGTWMYAAVDPVTSAMVDGEYAWLVSPPIDVSGAPKLIGQWTQWVDLPRECNDIFNLSLASNDQFACVTDPAGFVDESPGWWYGGPFWGTWNDNWDAFAGNDWLAIRWEVQNDDVPTIPHMAGIFVDRQRVGVPSGDAGTAWNLDTWNQFNDWFQEQIGDALLDTCRVEIRDDDGVASAYVLASNNNGASWQSYAMRQEDPGSGSNWYLGPPPAAQITAGSVIRYYFSMTDGDGNTSTLPGNAPDSYYEMSILPIDATPSSPGLLLVDKHGRAIPSEQRDYFHSSEYYFREALQILGYDWEKYDVEVPSGSTEQSNGPDTAGYKYYEKQIWFTDEFNAYTLKTVDQKNLIDWLNQAGSGKERNLLLSGNDIGYELMSAGKETLSFYETWLASQFVDNQVGVVTTDSVPGLQERAGGFTFMDYADGKCILQGGCPNLNYFDVVNVYPGIPGAQVVADYKKGDGTTRPAGVAYTHQTLGYQTVNLGFGIEFMMDGVVGGGSNYTPEGYHKTGIADRVNLLGNILEYFGNTPGVGTGVVDGARSTLSYAHPNPFNPVTKISYTIREAGPVTIEVYNIAGKVVRTLLDTKVEAGASGYVVWDGANDAGEKCASGVYFYRLNAPGFTETQKMVMMK